MRFISDLNQKKKIVTLSSFEPRTYSTQFCALTATLRTAVAKLRESVILKQRT